MTFLEAAIEVLRHEDDSLHFSAIAKKAVDRKLLSHVGRDPEAAMRTCLNSAVRAGAEGPVQRTKPGHYQIRPGAQLPEPAAPAPGEEPTPPEAPPEKASDPAPKPKRVRTRRSRTKKDKDEAPPEEAKAPAGGAAEASEGDAEEKPKPKRGRTRRKSSRAAKADPEPAAEQKAAAESGDAPADAKGGASEGNGEADDVSLEFEAPTGSGLEGVTDVEIVMANAMSRLAEERPELREELEAMQQQQQEEQSAVEPIIQTKPSRVTRRDEEERGGRRRRRRRRRARRVDWSASGGAAGGSATRTDELLDKVASVLEEAGPRSLHVRQIAETLASQNFLGGEISEIERAVTSAVLLDVHFRGRASRFAVRGDARYQLQGSRVPEKAAAAEHAFRQAAQTLERETSTQLISWLQSLGARALESLVRIYIEREGYALVATLPPGRGLGKLVARDPEGDDEEGRVLVLVVPQRTSLEPKLWDGEAERNDCGATLVFAMRDPGDERMGDARVIYAGELAAWLLRHGIAVQKVKVEVAVLDSSIIESIGGLDT
jgi:hypothetical protein